MLFTQIWLKVLFIYKVVVDIEVHICFLSKADKRCCISNTNKICADETKTIEQNVALYYIFALYTDFITYQTRNIEPYVTFRQTHTHKCVDYITRLTAFKCSPATSLLRRVTRFYGFVLTLLGEIDFLAGWLLHVRRNLDARCSYSHDRNRKGCYFRPIRRRRSGGASTSGGIEPVRRVTSHVRASSATCSVDLLLASRSKCSRRACNVCTLLRNNY